MSTPTNLFHTLDANQIAKQFNVQPEQGLTNPEATARLKQYGANELTERGITSPWAILWEQLTGKLVLILIAAAIISMVVGDYKDAIAILAIVVLNAILGVVQEYRAERAMAALKKLAVPLVKVRRENSVHEIAASQLVPGDVLMLEAGNVLPADARVIESANLRVQEAILTGESEPIEKETRVINDPNAPLGDQRNMVFMGTAVTYGRGQAIVVATGMQTELGKVAAMIQGVKDTATPMQKRLDQLGQRLGIAALALTVIVFTLGILAGEDVRVMFMTAISMAVALVPEGLPAVVTITLALGAQRMLKRNALIRKLPAVETLGSVTVICSDKTGTLTENRMTVTILDVAGHRIELSEQIRRDTAILKKDEQPIAANEATAIPLLLAGGALCNDSILKPTGSGAFNAVGDPTEGALVVSAARLGLWKADLDQAWPRVGEVPFDSERKRMTTVHRVPGSLPSGAQAIALAASGRSHIAFTKGAVDGLLQISNAVWTENRIEPMSETWKKRIVAASEELASKGMRVLGVAFRTLDSFAPNTLEHDLIFVGMVGMIDPPRPEVRAAVEQARAAGIRPVMITGDHPLTAREIARQLGIASNGKILTGQEVAKLSAAELEALVEEVSVYARVSPEHKLNIVNALQKRGHIVAMTGDGVNDAPALKQANIGVAMGITGTDVSKEAAEMVLLDDNFATIVAAVEEGRTVYDNIRKFVKFSIAGNIGKILVVLVAPILGTPLPLSPFQILWMNLVTDGVLGLGLSVEPSERGVMKRAPHQPSESIFSRGLARQIAWSGVLIGAIALAVGLWAWGAGRASWQTMILSTLIFSQIFQALSVRSSGDSLFRIGLLSNKPLLAASVLIFVLQIAVIYVSFLHGLFETIPLSLEELAITLVASSAILWAVEIEKRWG